MSLTESRHRLRADGASSVLVVALAAVILTACGAPAASSAPAEESAEPSAEASASATAAEPSASALVDELCLPAEIVAAIEEVGDGNFEPDVPLTDIADAVEPLDVSGMDDPSFAELLRDDLVAKLREPNPEFPAALAVAASGFLSEVEVAEC